MAWTPCCDENVTPDGELSSMRNRFSLMLITDPDASPGELVAGVTAAVRGGVTAVQVRRPGAGAGELLDLVVALTAPTRDGGAVLIVNDRVDVALAAGADGVHLKRSSIPLAEARKLLGPDMILGVSTHREEEVHEAVAMGADYVVFGPVFRTPSKEGILTPRGAERYGAIALAASIPVLALGGVNRHTLRELVGGTVPGVAVIRAILAADDPEAAARELRSVLARSGPCES